MSNGVTFAKGFKAAGVACGIKKNGDKDLALIVAEEPATAAGVFTQNIVKGHSLALSMENIKHGQARAVVLNSGNANACLAERGRADALQMAKITADVCGAQRKEILTGSTGVIGVPLDMVKIEAGINAAYAALSTEGTDAAEAIMTTDTMAKTAETKVVIDGETIRIGGMAKGSGMIHPNMATMIGVVTTDAKMDAKALQRALNQAVSQSFNRISVDGDTSVCDKVLLLASGKVGKNILVDTPDYEIFLQGLIEVSQKLAKMLAADGEGATKLLTIKAENVRSQSDAQKITEAIAKSPLCKTAAFGRDANWGRLLTAAGYSGGLFDPEKVDIYIGDVMVCRDGGGLAFDEAAALKVLSRDEVTYRLDFKDGEAEDTMWTCDLTYDYVKINGEYRT
ncbi:MAG: bifunctional glutamate N-acetyltransferase/amino-acid acetyltransferase ArgJ [Eubacteriales bacterium]